MVKIGDLVVVKKPHCQEFLGIVLDMDEDSSDMFTVVKDGTDEYHGCYPSQVSVLANERQLEDYEKIVRLARYVADDECTVIIPMKRTNRTEREKT